jgi:hypothetical protein
MELLKIAFTIFLSAFYATAQVVSISGIISNKNGKPISGAIVLLESLNLKDTTDVNGAYSIKSNNVLSKPTIIEPVLNSIIFTNGNISIKILKATFVTIEIFDVNGHLLKAAIKDLVVPGDYRHAINKYLLAMQVMVVRVTVGNQISTFRYLSHDNSQHTVATSVVTSSDDLKFARAQVTVDSLKVSARSFISKKVAIPSYQEMTNITLDTINLPNFSFFVTSRVAIQTFGGSNGFGGDLRFGHTGPGAGLRGADSICQCIAEKSMAGSKVKIWRAFLSSSTNETGEKKQVNAIERIGNGPWYDRTERVVAPTIADLLNKRPQNGDADIMDDLPNEDGIPNHRPDPTKPNEDNHHTLTGTGEDGKLFGVNATCDDWTSVTASGKPRMGFSWPRASGWVAGNEGRHWISGWDGAGCEAGIDIDEKTLFGKSTDKFVGSGGGYGGFYCFAQNP